MNNAGLNGLDDMAEFGRKMFQGILESINMLRLIYRVADYSLPSHESIKSSNQRSSNKLLGFHIKTPLKILHNTALNHWF